MATALMQPLDLRARRRALRKEAESFIKPNDRLTSLERLEIYHRQYWIRLKDCFYDDYPGLRAVLGDRRFDQLTCAYLARHPSQSFTLRNLGRRLVGFLESEPHWIAPRRQLALDMARLEWAHIEAFDSEAVPPLEINSLLNADPAKIHLRLQPHLSLLQLHYEVDELLIQIKHGERLRNDASNAVELHPSRSRPRPLRRLRPKAVFLAVHRHDNTVFYKRLEPGQFRLLSALRANATLAAACQQWLEAETAPADADAQVKSWFEVWASLGWFCRLE
jgi:hypothetical protein